MKLTFEVSEDMIMWAFRYALGRRTGAVTDVCDFLKANWKDLQNFTKLQIRDEIKHAIQMERVGDNCDIEQWEEILLLFNL